MGKSNLARLIDSMRDTPVIEAVAPRLAVSAKDTTATQYSALEYAFKLFNKECFNNELPQVLITFQRYKKTFGYYSPNRLESRGEEALVIPEIALNIGSFGMRTDKQIFSTLLHEMVHHWQHVYGKPSRNGYHCKEWGAKMKEVGLYPSNTGEVGGKETGQQMTHYFMAGGKFEGLFEQLQKENITINWQSKELVKPAKGSKAGVKQKFTCPCCEANAWAKPESSLLCGVCSDEDTLVKMIEA